MRRAGWASRTRATTSDGDKKFCCTNSPSARPMRSLLAGMMAVCGIGRFNGCRNKAVTANQSASAPTIAASAVVPYLTRLGVSHLYTSPIPQAAPGSTHGYDVVDHSHINAELGGADGYERLQRALRQHGMGHVLDIVPNHMAVAGRANPW